MTYIFRQLLAKRPTPRCTSHRRTLTGTVRHGVTLKRVKYKRTGNCISRKCERPRCYQPLLCARERKINLEREREHTLPVVKMHQLLLSLSLSLASAGIPHVPRKLSFVVTFALAARGIFPALLRTMKIVRRESDVRIRGTARSESSYYGWLNEQFLSAFILLDIAHVSRQKKCSG